MRKYLLAAVAAAAIASPAMARDGSGYVGIEGGILFPKDQDADLFVDYTTTQTPATPVVVGPADTTFNNTFGLDYKMGYDVDALVGYDFGMFRLEGEIGYKRSKINDLEISSSGSDRAEHRSQPSRPRRRSGSGRHSSGHRSHRRRHRQRARQRPFGHDQRPRRLRRRGWPVLLCAASVSAALA